MTSVSVIVPTFNAAGTLDRCLASLTAQTSPLHEIVVVDDGSTDHSAAIAATYAKSNRSVHVHRQTNAGVSAARNRGLDCVSGDFVGFVDPDDFVNPDMYARLVQAAVDSDAPMAALRINSIRASVPVPYSDQDQVVTSNEAMSDLLQLRYPTSVWAHIYSRKAIEELRFDPRVGYFEDLLFNFEILRRVQRVVLVSGSYYNYEPGPSGANLGAISEKHLSVFDVCSTLRQSVAEDSLPLWNELADLEAHCLRSTIYKAATSPDELRGVDARVRAFARAISPECRTSNIGWLDQSIVFAASHVPHALIHVTRVLIRCKRVLSAVIVWAR